MRSRPPGYGESQPRLIDDRLPIVLLVLDGLGDRPVPELDGQTPAEAADTPVLDALAARGASGWHLPFGWGRAASSELAHWAMFGYERSTFPGRAVLEALGGGVEISLGAPIVHASLRTSQTRADEVWITGRAAEHDHADVARLLDTAGQIAARSGIGLHALSPAARGEATLVLPAGSGAISDSDPFFEDRHPWLRPQATAPDGEPSAALLRQLLLTCRTALRAHPANDARRARGLPALDVLTTKWAGTRTTIPPFAERAGIVGAAVTSARLYRGIAEAVGLRVRDVAPGADAARDLRTRLTAAEEMIEAGASFVHVHTKATDEAGHTKQPHAKRLVLESLDGGLGRLLDIADRAVVCVTGDHATPSTGGVLHTGDPTPLLIAGPTVRPDSVDRLGETFAARGMFGVLSASDILPALLGFANRPAFLGHQPTAAPTLALPDRPEPMPAAGDG